MKDYTKHWRVVRTPGAGPGAVNTVTRGSETNPVVWVFFTETDAREFAAKQSEKEPQYGYRVVVDVAHYRAVVHRCWELP